MQSRPRVILKHEGGRRWIEPPQREYQQKTEYDRRTQQDRRPFKSPA